MEMILLSIVSSVLAAIILAEIEGWSPRLSRSFVLLAVRLLPADQRARYEEEWFAHLDTMPTAISKLAVAAGFGIASAKIWLEQEGKQKARSVTRATIIRGFDVVFSASAIVFLLPLMAITALAVKISDPGPVMHRQTLICNNGRVISLLKFRTTTVGHYDDNQALIPRLTVIGKFLRITSIDELPMIFSILKGDMGFVGPRASNLRSNVGLSRPGLVSTDWGWWPLTGEREMRLAEMMRQYQQNPSARLYIRIIFILMLAIVKP